LGLSRRENYAKRQHVGTEEEKSTYIKRRTTPETEKGFVRRGDDQGFGTLGCISGGGRVVALGLTGGKEHFRVDE